ncbi:MAG: type II secretion system protein [Candidatus Melainabacteria bacterium]|nr:type II secretion system protein [Candidatus Melainabacteria bacterium]
MMPHLSRPKPRRRVGFSLVEVIIALGIMATATIGIYIAMQSMIRTTVKAMERDVEAAFASMKIAEVNPYRLDVETAYDVTTKTLIDLGNNRKAYYTRLVESDADKADIKKINVYLYRKASSTTPYRQFKKEVAPRVMAYNFGSSSWYKDATGQVWTPYPSSTPAYDLSTRRSGSNSSTGATGSTGATIAQTDDQALFQNYFLDDCDTHYFLASAGRTYTVTFGFTTGVAGSDVVYIFLNDVLQTPTGLNLATEAGGANRAIVKSFKVTPTSSGGVYFIKTFVRDSTALAGACSGVTRATSFIKIERTDI